MKIKSKILLGCSLALVVLVLAKILFFPSRVVHVIPYQHFDPYWLRKHGSGYTHNGTYVAPHSRVEDIVINKYLEYAGESDYSFVLDNAYVLRSFLERHPDTIKTFRRLARKGQFEPVGGMETTPDTNIPCGESLVRNILYGKLWMEETFKTEVRTAWFVDVFGMTAQVPQIVKKCDFDWLPRRGRPFFFDNFRWWRGLDGTLIYSGNAIRGAYYRGIWESLSCPSCSGKGCGKCDGNGINSVTVPSEGIKQAFDIDIEKDPFSQVRIEGEESLPNPDLPELIRDKNRENIFHRWRFSNYHDGYRRIRDKNYYLPGSSSSVVHGELNPVFTGCYTSRSKLKSLNRKAENTLISAEKIAAIASTMGYFYPTGELPRLWKLLAFTQFHDGVTGSHVDPVYRHLTGVYSEIITSSRRIRNEALDYVSSNVSIRQKEGNVMPFIVFNTLNWERTDIARVNFYMESPLKKGCVPFITDDKGDAPVMYGHELSRKRRKLSVTFLAGNIPPLGYRIYFLEFNKNGHSPKKAGEVAGDMENEFYRISFDRKTGLIKGIFDRKNNFNVIDSSGFFANELCIQEDIGSIYSTLHMGDLKRLGPGSVFSSSSDTGSLKKVVTEGSYNKTKWEQEVTLYNGLPFVDFTTTVEWNEPDSRLRVVFPTFMKENHGYYEIPYGTIRRERYEILASSTNPDATKCGDWPAQNWVSVSDRKYGVALINSGNPGNMVENGNIFMSLLRSPGEMFWGVIEPRQGARDYGKHVFRYRLYSHTGTWDRSGTVLRGYEMNQPLVCRPADFHYAL